MTVKYAEIFDRLINSNLPLTEVFEANSPINSMDLMQGIDDEITNRFEIDPKEFTSSLVASGKLTINQYQRIRIATVILSSNSLFDNQTIEATREYLKKLDEHSEHAVKVGTT